MIDIDSKQKEFLSLMKNQPYFIEFIANVNFNIGKQGKGVCLISSDYFYLVSKKTFLSTALDEKYKISDYKILLYHNELLNRKIFLINIQDGTELSIEFKKPEELNFFVKRFNSLFEEYKKLENTIMVDNNVMETSNSDYKNIQVAGLYYENRRNKLNHLLNSSNEVNEEYQNFELRNVYLVKEPNNRFDKYAIKIMVNTLDGNLHIGYIPKTLSKELTNQFNNIVNVHAYIDDFSDPNYNVLLNISLD